MADENEEKDIKYYEEKYKFLLDSHEFEDLEAELKKPNIFSILEIARMEIKHSNFLAWLLNPDGSHGLGNKFLIRVLRDLSLDANNKLKIVKTNRLNFSNVEISRELSSKYGSIDLLINFKDNDDKVVICIENKIDTTDFDDQLNRYENYVNESFNEYNVKIFVYLIPNGSKPEDVEKHEKWHCYSYEKIIKHLEDIQKAINDSTIKTYISAYLSTLRLEIMGMQGEAQELANAIYKEHSEIIDFVVNNRDINKGYQQTWESDEYKKPVLEFAENLKILVKEVDPNGDYDIGFTEAAITIKRKFNNTYYKLYSLFPRGKRIIGRNMEFSFLSKNDENEDTTKTKVKELVDKNKMMNSDIKYSDGNFFTIYSVNLLSSEELQKIHKIRLGLD